MTVDGGPPSRRHRPGPVFLRTLRTRHASLSVPDPSERIISVAFIRKGLTGDLILSDVNTWRFPPRNRAETCEYTGLRVLLFHRVTSDSMTNDDDFFDFETLPGILFLDEQRTSPRGRNSDPADRPSCPRRLRSGVAPSQRMGMNVRVSFMPDHPGAVVPPLSEEPSGMSTRTTERPVIAPGHSYGIDHELCPYCVNNPSLPDAKTALLAIVMLFALLLW